MALCSANRAGIAHNSHTAAQTALPIGPRVGRSVGFRSAAGFSLHTSSTSYLRPVAHIAHSSSNASSTSSGVSAVLPPQLQEFSVWLNSKELERSVRLEVLPEGNGQAIVVAEVDESSAAAQAGVEVGQKLLGISDPVRDSEVWDMGDRPSLRFVRDTLRMRRMGQVQLVLSAAVPAYIARLAPPPPPADAPPASEASAGESMDDGSSLRRVSALDSLLSGSESDVDGPSNSPPPPGAMTLGERMAAEYAAKQAAQQQVSEVNKRIARRAAYMDEVSQRNDTPLAAGLLLAFLGPAVIILGVAAGTGYLDRLYDVSLTLR